MNTLNEKRGTTRLTIETEVTLLDQEQNTFIGKIKNLSATGAFIETGDQLTSYGSYKLSINLQGDSSNLLVENLFATVVRQEGKGIAVEFTDTMEWITLFYVYKQKLKLVHE
jgi:PilZ domain